MRRLALLCCLIAGVAACGDAGTAPLEMPVPPTSMKSGPSDTRSPAPTAGEVSIGASLHDNVYEGFAAAGSSNATLVALSRGETEVFLAPADTEPWRILPATTILGTATVITAVGQPVDGWLQVMLPGRPNGSTGWIETDRVDLYIVADRLVIDLSDRELIYYSDGIELLRSEVAVGTSHNPTPTGEFFVTDLVDISGGGPWGPAALGLSARSETITEFNGGDGIIGIHGTNKPGSIGQAASLGCVRLPNEVITELRQMVSLGTPVEIRA